MASHDLTEVTFTLPDESTARWLDRMIASSGMTPDQWFTELIHNDRRGAASAGPEKLSALLDKVAAGVPGSPAAANPDAIDDTGRTVPPRPAHARATRGSAAWRA